MRLTSRGETVAAYLGALGILLLVWAAEAIAYAVTGVAG